MTTLILKTDIENAFERRIVSQDLDTHPAVMRWTVDTDDIDKVLKVVTNGKLTYPDVINMLRRRNFYAEELI